MSEFYFEPVVDVEEFMKTSGQDSRTEVPALYGAEFFPLIANAKELRDSAAEYAKEMPSGSTLSVRLLTEELAETIEAFNDGDIIGVADGLIDLVYIAIGCAIRHGIDFEAVWNEVHKSNMAKFPDGKVIRDESGKVCKPEGWEPPNIEKALFGA